MNATRYRLIFNKKTHSLCPVAECVVSRSDVASSVGETSAGSAYSGLRIVNKTLSWAIAMALLLPWSVSTFAQTLPTGGQVGVGAGSIQQSGAMMNIHQQSQKMGINWQSYNIGAGNTVNYHQPNAQAIALNRVIGNSRSEIYGNLNANGKVFLINQNGILFGRNAQINVGGLLATTKNMSDEDFMNEQYHLLGNSASEIINQGNLHAENGAIVLAADTIKNTGTITTPNGRVILAAGQQLNLSIDTFGDIQVGVTQSTLDALIENKGLIAADNGEVYLTARGKEMLQKSVINIEGEVRATYGTVVIDGDNADDSGNVIINDGTIDVSNDGSENNGKAGSVTVIGKNIGLLGNAKIKADGKYGGGTVLIGGDYLGTGDIPHAQAVVMQKDALIEASATDSGKGGKVILWSDKYTGFFGAINAKGGVNGGDGGFVETSSKDTLSVMGGRVKANAENGQKGEWLLDPGHINIVASGSTTASNISPPDITWEGAGNVLNTDISTALGNDTDVTLTTNGTGTIDQASDAHISKSGGSGSATLTLNASTISMYGNVTSTSASGVLNLNYTSSGAVLLRSGSNINVTGNVAVSAALHANLHGNITAGSPGNAKTITVTASGWGLRVDDQPITIASHGGDITLTGISTNYNGIRITKNLIINAGATGRVNITGSTGRDNWAGIRTFSNPIFNITASQVNIVGNHTNVISTSGGSRGMWIDRLNVTGGGLSITGNKVNNSDVLAVYLGPVTVGGDFSVASSNGPADFNSINATGDVTISAGDLADLRGNIMAGSTGNAKTITVTAASGGVRIDQNAITIDSNGGDITLTGTASDYDGIRITKNLTINAGATGRVNITGSSSMHGLAGIRTLSNPIFNITASQVNITGNHTNATSTAAGSRGMWIDRLNVMGGGLSITGNKVNNSGAYSVYFGPVTVDGDFSVASSNGPADFNSINATGDVTISAGDLADFNSINATGDVTISAGDLANLRGNIMAGSTGNAKTITVTAASGGVRIDQNAITIDSNGGDITLTGDGGSVRHGIFSDQTLTINAGSTGTVNITGCTSAAFGGIRFWEAPVTITASRVNMVGRNTDTVGHAAKRGMIVQNLIVNEGDLFFNGHNSETVNATSILTDNIKVDGNFTALASGGEFRARFGGIEAGASGAPQKHISITSQNMTTDEAIVLEGNLTTTGDITLRSNAGGITKSNTNVYMVKSGGGDATLTMHAKKAIPSLSEINSTSGAWNVNLTSDDDSIDFATGTSVITNGGDFTLTAGDNIDFFSTLTTGGGNVTLTAGSELEFNGSSITTGGGNLEANTKKLRTRNSNTVNVGAGTGTITANHTASPYALDTASDFTAIGNVTIASIYNGGDGSQALDISQASTFRSQDGTLTLDIKSIQHANSYQTIRHFKPITLDASNNGFIDFYVTSEHTGGEGASWYLGANAHVTTYGDVNVTVKSNRSGSTHGALDIFNSLNLNHSDGTVNWYAESPGGGINVRGGTTALNLVNATVNITGVDTSGGGGAAEDGIKFNVLNADVDADSSLTLNGTSDGNRGVDFAEKLSVTGNIGIKGTAQGDATGKTGVRFSKGANVTGDLDVEGSTVAGNTAAAISLVGQNLTSGGNVTLRSPDGILYQASPIVMTGSNTNLTITTGSAVDITSDIYSASTATGVNMNITSGTSFSQGNLSDINVSGDIVIAAKGNVDLRGPMIKSTAGNITIAAGIDDAAGTTTGGDIVQNSVSNGSVNVAAGNVVNLYTGAAALSSSDDTAVQNMRSLLSTSTSSGALHYNSNYSATPSNTSSKFNVFVRKKADLTVSASPTTYTKTYDGVANLSGITLTMNTGLKGDVATTCNSIVANFSSSNVGSYSTNDYAIPSNTTITNANFTGGVYGFTTNTAAGATTPNVTVNVTKRHVTVWWNSFGGSKTYDGTANAAAAIQSELITSVPNVSNQTPGSGMVMPNSTDGGYSGGSIANSGIVVGENLTVSKDYVFNSNHAANNVGIAVKNIVLANGTNGLASNYKLVHPNTTDHATNVSSTLTTLTGNITVRNITITSNTGLSKTYGTNDTQVNFQSYTLESRNNTTNTGLVSGDTFTGNMGREAGEGVALYNFTVGSLTNTNYNITFNGSANQYNITKAALTITALDQSKTYDGSLNVGNVSAYTNVGLVNGVTVNSFNGTGVQSATTIADSITNVTLAYGDVNVGIANKTITANNAVLAGGGGANSTANYNITYNNHTASSILVRNITITSNAASKVYGTNDTQANFQNYTLESRNNTTNTGLVSGDTFTGNMGREGGEGVDLYNFTVGSLDNTNYNITFDGSANQYNITKAELTITALDQSKTYDGSLNVGNVSAYTNVGLLNGVTVNSFNETGAAVATTITDSVANVTLVYGDKNAGNGNKTITVSAANLGGSAANYSITYENATGATIEKRNITITSNETSKVYGTNDTQANFQNYTLESRNNTTNTGLVSGDTFTGNMGREGGEGVDLYNFTVGSLDNTNYNITFDGSANQYNITKAELTITALDQSKTYDGSLNVGNVSAYTNVGLLNGVTVNSFNETGAAVATTITDSVANVTLVYGDKNAGNGNKTITVSAANLGGSAANYSITYENATGATIEKRNITITSNEASKVYGTNDTQANFQNYTLESRNNTTNTGLVSGDTFTGNMGREGGEGVDLYNFTVGSLDNTNYNITFDGSANQYNITKAELTITALDQSKTYDGSLNVGNVSAYTNVGLLNGVTVNSFNGTGVQSATTIADSITNVTLAYGDVNVGIANKTITANNAVLAGGGGANSTANYNITYNNHTASSILVRNITITSNAASKVYGTNDTQANFQNYTLESRNNTTNTGLVSGDTFTGNMGREGGEGVDLYNFTVGSLDNTNYNITFDGSANQYNITKAELTITALDQSKTYDGSLNVGNVSAYTNVGLLNGVTVNSFNETGAAVATTITDSVANVTLVYGDKNAGNGNKTITVSAANLGGSAANYSITYENATGATIEKRNITITSNEASKVYGTNDTQANFQNYTLESRNNTTNTGLVSGDTFTGNMGREGGEGVDLYNFTVGSLDNTNYNITFDGSANQYNITKAELTITALDQSKTYDGSLNVGNVSAYTNVGLLNGVTVNSFNGTGVQSATTIADSITNVTLAYGDVNVGIANKTITANNAVLAGGGGANSTANYNITYNNHTASSILVRNITITSNAASKVYGTNDTQANFQNYTLESRNNTTNTGLVSGDTFTGNMGREGGEGVDLYNFTVGSLDNTNYNITFDGSANQYNITKAELTITALDQSKTYDGSLNVGNVSAYTNVGLLNGVTVNSFNETGAAVATTITDSVANVTLVYGDKNAGNGNKTITVSAANLGGSAANYSITYENATGATIEKRNITITSNEASKVYGTNDTQANFQNYTLESRNNTTNTGLVSGDTFTGNMGREAGEGVDLYNFTVGSLDNTNYNITFDGSANQYNITKAELTITALDQSKTYDGSLNVGNVSAYTNVGLLNGVTVNSFNGTGVQSATTIADSITNVTLAYGDVNVGIANKTITANNAVLAGGGGANSTANYNITYNNHTASSILVRNITITSNAASKVYGTNDTQANFQNYTLESRNNTTNTGLVSGDTFTGNMGREGGEGVDLYNFTVGSLDNTNYNITFDGSANQYNITKAELTITALDQSKTYDGSLNVGNVSAYTNVGLLNGVTVNSFNETGAAVATTITDSVANVTLVYGDKNAGNGNKTITVSAANLGGSAANYSITYENATGATIEKRNITITSNEASKVYGTNDTQANFQNYTLESRNNTTNTGLVSGDTFTGNMGREAGEGVDLYNFTVGSLDNTNYNITFDGSANQYNITKAELTITALDQSKTYDGSLNVGNVSAYTNVGLLNGVTVNSFNETGAAVATTITDSVANVTLVYGDKNAGNGNKTITVSAANLGGSAANYSITYENATGATIEKRNITITSNEASKVYGTNDTQANFQNYTLESRNNTTNTGLVSGDTFTGNMGREGGEGVDLYNFTVGSLDNTNYNITFDGSANQYNITKAELTITALDQSKTYDGSLNVGNVSAYTNVGLLNGVTVNSFNGTGVQSATTIADSITNVTLAYGDVNVGIANKTITANNAVLAGGGGANSTANYNITYNNHTASSILVRNITITSNAASKVYGTNDTQANFQNYTLESRNNTTNTGLVSGDTFTGNMGREGGEGVDLYNFTVGSLDNTNYNITFDGSANQYNITKAELTITALDQSKTYDGSLNVGNVSAYTNVGLLNGVTVNSFNETGAAVATTITDSVANVTLVYGDKNAGNGNKTITVSAANLGGSAANYSITYENATGATIEKRNITITSNEASKVYGTNDTQANFQNYTLESRNNTTNTGLVSGDTFTGNMGREAGEGVDLYNFTVGSLDNTNYNITFDGSANQYNITKAELTITALDQSKTYDGSLNVGNVSAYTNVGLLNGVTVNSFNETGAAVATTITDSVANVTLVYGDKNAGNGNKTITVSAANLGGSAANYSITYENATGATIEKRNITITSNEASKVYGTNDTQANFQNYTLESRNNTTNTGLVSGDTFTGNMGREGGEGVDLYNFTVGSLDNTNYNITFDGSANQYNITKAELTITALDQSKTYDGSLNVGNVSAYTNVGLLNGVTVNSFNETGAAVATTITDSVANVTLVYGDKNAGNGNKTITVSAANLGGSAANYSITYENATGATIEKRNITITSNEASKVYGTNDTQANFQNYTLESRNNTTNTGLVSGDTFTGNMGREGGEGVDLYNFTVGSLDNTNYNITFDGSANQYNITKAELTITALDQSKTYDGSLNVGNVSAYTNVGLLNGVTVNSFNETGAAVATTITDSVANVTLVYGDKNAGNGNKTITVSAANLGGSAANYSITYENATGATIEKRNITITSNEASKVYGTNDTQANFQNYTLESRNNTTNTGLVSGDTFTGNMGREGGEGVDLYNFTVGSLDNTNYNITFDGSANQYTITQALLTPKIVNQTKVYGDDDPDLADIAVTLENIVTSSSVQAYDQAGSYTTVALPTESINVSATVDSLNRDSGEAVGNYTISSGSVIATSANFASYYQLDSLNVTGLQLGITKRTLIMTGVTVNDKTYDGTDSAVFNMGTSTYSGIVNRTVSSWGGGSTLIDDTNDVTVTYNTATTQARFDDAHVGINKSVILENVSLNITGSNAIYYDVSSVEADITADILKRVVFVDAIVDEKTYDGTTQSAKTPLASEQLGDTGLLSGDRLTGLSQSFDQAGAQGKDALTLTPNVSGYVVESDTYSSINSDYDVQVRNTATGTINKKSLLITLQSDEVENGASYTPTFSYSGFVDGDSAELLGINPTIEALDTTKAGKYQLTPQLKSVLSNYDVAFVGSQVTVLEAKTTTVDSDLIPDDVSDFSEVQAVANIVESNALFATKTHEEKQSAVRIITITIDQVKRPPSIADAVVPEISGGLRGASSYQPIDYLETETGTGIGTETETESSLPQSSVDNIVEPHSRFKKNRTSIICVNGAMKLPEGLASDQSSIRSNCQGG